MMLTSMRDHGVRSVDAFCAVQSCSHEATVNVDDLPDELPVPDISLRLRCSHCGSGFIEVRPNWAEMWADGMGRSDYARRTPIPSSAPSGTSLYNPIQRRGQG